MDALPRSPTLSRKKSRLERFKKFCDMTIRKIRALLASTFVFIGLFGAALIASLVQFTSYIFLSPFSRSRHRRLCLLFNHAFFLCSTFLLERWSGVTFRVYGRPLDKLSTHLCVINHHSDVDWLIGLAFIAKMGYPYPGNAKSVVKASLGKVPLFGTILRFAEFAFLTRSWQADRDRFLKSLYALRGYTQSCSPFWFTLYPEGTRLTQEKLERSQAYATSRQLQPLKSLLFPRFKAFTAIASTLRNEFDGVVDATLMFEGDLPSMKATLAGVGKTVIHAHVKYYPMQELPEGEQELEKWLLDRWYEKDKLITDFRKDPSCLGAPTSDFFPRAGERSLTAFYALIASSFLGALTLIYLLSKIPNALYVFMALSAAATILTAIFTVLNIQPSRKGAKKRTQVSRNAQELTTASSCEGRGPPVVVGG